MDVVITFRWSSVTFTFKKLGNGFLPIGEHDEGPFKGQILYVTVKCGEAMGRVQIAVRLFKLWDSYRRGQVDENSSKRQQALSDKNVPILPVARQLYVPLVCFATLPAGQAIQRQMKNW
jgi:hypothetical protein